MMLTVTRRRRWPELRLPHALFIDGLYAGTFYDTISLDVPRGTYSLRVQFGGAVPLGRSGRSLDLSLSSTARVTVDNPAIVEFYDREMIWNILFDIDLVVWVVSLFVTLPPVYKMVSDIFFAVWLVRLVVIRRRYYRIVTKK